MKRLSQLACAALITTLATGTWANGNFSLTTINKLDKMETISVEGICSDSKLLTSNEDCHDAANPGQTPAGESMTCDMPMSVLTMICGSNCHVEVYNNDQSCSGTPIGQATLSADASGVNVNITDAGQITYEGDAFNGTLVSG